MQVEGFFSKRCKPLATALSGIFLLIGFTACNHAPSPDVMATVNGKDISRSDLDKAYGNYKANQGQAPQEPSTEQANMVRLTLLQKMIDEEILQQRAEKLNLNVDFLSGGEWTSNARSITRGEYRYTCDLRQLRQAGPNSSHSPGQAPWSMLRSGHPKVHAHEGIGT